MSDARTLRDLRRNRGLTQEQLARAIHVATKSVCEWEAGTVPRPHNRRKVLHFFNRPLVEWKAVFGVEAT